MTNKSMNQKNDINKQFSENNNKAFSSFATLIGSFIAVFYLYVQMFIKDTQQEHLFFVTILVYMVLSFLAALSVFQGYSRRRDHIVACASDPNDTYSKICGNGKGKGLCTYLLSSYCLFYVFFLIANALFFCFSIYKFCPNKGMWMWTANLVLGVSSLVIQIVVYLSFFCKYKKMFPNNKINRINLCGF